MLDMLHIAMIGIDGSGKTTAIQMLKEYSKLFKINVVCSDIKGDNYYLVKQAVKGEFVNRDSIAIACAFDLYKLYYELENTNPGIVLWDRFSYCIEACNTESVFICVKDILNGIPKPMYTFYFDLDPKTALLRLQRRGDIKPHETLEFLTECRRRYISLKETYDFVCIDASKSESDVFNDILTILKESEILC